MSDIYLCTLPDSISVTAEQQKKVLVRFYRSMKEANGKSDDRTVDAVNSILLGRRGLGPNVYGITQKGRIDEYIPWDTMQKTDAFSSTLSANVARALARFHATKMPLPKNERCVLEWIDHYYNCFQEKKPELSWAKEAEGKKALRELLSINFEPEIFWLKAFMSKAETDGLLPVVFSHNDISPDNILTSGQPHFDVMFIDFELSGFNWRGFDFIFYFNVLDVAFEVDDEGCLIREEANESFREQLILDYIAESKNLTPSFESTKTNGLEHILKEALICQLGLDLFLTLIRLIRWRTDRQWVSKEDLKC